VRLSYTRGGRRDTERVGELDVRAGAPNSPGPSSYCPYSPKCLVEEFSEVGLPELGFVGISPRIHREFIVAS
jgi:hypothetical protein